MNSDQRWEIADSLNLKGEILITDSYYDASTDEVTVVIYLAYEGQYAGEKAVDLMDSDDRIFEIDVIEDHDDHGKRINTAYKILVKVV
tara:strand:- start:39 stop:302 length:264 start_codon:yes stop_codon:yes gene_type:complete